MKLLLDTHILLWWLNNSSELSVRAKGLVADPSSTVFLSAVAIWEIRIKESLGKLRLPKTFEKVLAGEAFEELPITIEHAHLAGRLPVYHRDPFDRMLIAQALCENLTTLTHDRIFTRYGGSVVLV